MEHKAKPIVPGTQIVRVISAKRGGNAERVLLAIASQESHGGGRTERLFANDWLEDGGVSVASGLVRHGNTTLEVVLKLGSSEGLALVDSPGRVRSMSPVKGGMTLRIGSDLKDPEIRSLARHIVGCWVVHGREWTNRRGVMFKEPYGFGLRRAEQEEIRFKVVDGKNHPTRIGDLVGLDCTRSTHVGDWGGRHSTLVAAFCGMRLVLHELKAEGKEVCLFRGVNIGEDVGLWGPYCKWNEIVRHSDGLDKWRSLAIEAASPFSFHVHATRSLFPDSELFSSLLLKKIGQEKLREVLNRMIAHDPERFYRLIDASGITHRLTEVGESVLTYGAYGTFNKTDIVGNVLATFQDLNSIQSSIGFVIPHRDRVVLDSHFYIVAEVLAAGSPTQYSLSGRDMHRYLTDGGSANMHRVRNDRLFSLLRDLFGMTTVEFHVYPPLTIDSGLASQYSEPDKLAVEGWLSYEA